MRRGKALLLLREQLRQAYRKEIWRASDGPGGVSESFEGSSRCRHVHTALAGQVCLKCLHSALPCFAASSLQLLVPTSALGRGAAQEALIDPYPQSRPPCTDRRCHCFEDVVR